MNTADFGRLTGEKDFVRLSRKFPLSGWEHFIPPALQTFDLALKAMQPPH